MFVSRKRFEELEKEFNEHKKYFFEFQNRLDSNGIATAINKLNEEVFKNTKETRDNISITERFLFFKDYPKEPTMKAKVDAIVKYLKIDFNIKGAQKEQVEVSPKRTVKATKRGKK